MKNLLLTFSEIRRSSFSSNDGFFLNLSKKIAFYLISPILLLFIFRLHLFFKRSLALNKLVMMNINRMIMLSDDFDYSKKEKYLRCTKSVFLKDFKFNYEEFDFNDVVKCKKIAGLLLKNDEFVFMLRSFRKTSCRLFLLSYYNVISKSMVSNSKLKWKFYKHLLLPTYLNDKKKEMKELYKLTEQLKLEKDSFDLELERINFKTVFIASTPLVFIVGLIYNSTYYYLIDFPYYYYLTLPDYVFSSLYVVISSITLIVASLIGLSLRVYSDYSAFDGDVISYNDSFGVTVLSIVSILFFLIVFPILADSDKIFIDNFFLLIFFTVAMKFKFRYLSFNLSTTSYFTLFVFISLAIFAVKTAFSDYYSLKDDLKANKLSEINYIQPGKGALQKYTGFFVGVSSDNYFYINQNFSSITVFERKNVVDVSFIADSKYRDESDDVGVIRAIKDSVFDYFRP